MIQFAATLRLGPTGLTFSLLFFDEKGQPNQYNGIVHATYESDADTSRNAA
jgi:hypothetical protein